MSFAARSRMVLWLSHLLVCPVPPDEIARVAVEETFPEASVVNILAEAIGIFKPDFTLKFLSDTYSPLQLNFTKFNCYICA